MEHGKNSSDGQIPNYDKWEGKLLNEAFPFSIQVSSFQGLGSKYDHNEDSIFVFHSNLLTDQDEIKFGIFIVADGMGGHESGEIASNMAVRLMAEKILRYLYLPTLISEENNNRPPVQEVLEEAIKDINRIVFQSVPGGGTTLTTVVSFGNTFSIAHIGDTRAYIITEEGGIERLTEDQTLVQRLITVGQFTEEEARQYPQRNILYNAIGQSERVDPVVFIRRRPEKCSLLLCSDGLWDVIEDTRINEIVNEEKDLSNACKQLVQEALDNGGQDNISVILVRFESI